MKRFTYGLVGYAHVEAETQEEADSKLWDLSLLETNVEIDCQEQEDIENT